VFKWSQFLAKNSEIQVRISALPDSMRRSDSEKGSTELREDKCGATLTKKAVVRFYKTEINGSGDPLR
jgi:hypothetical protein